MNDRVPASELELRINKFRRVMNEQHPDWKMAVIFSRINLLYFAGSMPEGMLIIEREKDATLWARRGFERAAEESEFPAIMPMGSYRDAAPSYPKISNEIYLETEFVPLAMFQRFQKHFPFSTYKSIDFQIAQIRAVKSVWELNFIEKAAGIHQRVLEERVPELLREGMSEAEFAAEMFPIMVQEGHQGSVRFGMHDTEMALGQLGFGESSLYPTSFDGPGGNLGVSPAVPSFGNRNIKLKKGHLVFVDVAVAVNGYHSDKTMTYMFGEPLDKEVQSLHNQCVGIQNEVAEILKPGNTPESIYENIINGLTPEFLKNFMGFGNRQVKFLGHGIGLTIDEYPVLAKGFKAPLEENMVFAVEPKKGIEGVGMVGIENTFVVTPEGGRCITGCSPGLILVE
ncbi:M24 family metallopeptidase [Maribellus maritimus]|uniref:M24 family metallopeptidase n=1 Tax=Maribellus maritimus TaxID=2870838 RepID=UPI001EEAE92B|nr:Xaa-Pro peptidase family protein [Maribellus maritimus]MCG6188712.1 Xaa-Pro peptidase family protein [Maribellus maritimus]